MEWATTSGPRVFGFIFAFFVYCEEEHGQEWKQGRSWMNKQNTKESGLPRGTETGGVKKRDEMCERGGKG